jgi:mono/diheme cytochrome c family protein/DNA-binding beta-propeller fold protein YncE
MTPGGNRGWVLVAVGVCAGLGLLGCNPPDTRSGWPSSSPVGVGGSFADGGVSQVPPGTVCNGPGSDGGRALGGPGFPVNLPATVVRATKPVPAISGGTLRVLADGKTAVVSDPERDQVSIVDLATRALRAQVALPAGSEPGRVVEDAAGRVHVALRSSGGLATIDPVMGTLTNQRAVCSAPRGIAYETATDLVHVACAGGELVSLPAAGGAATRTLTLERDLRDVVVGTGGKLLVSTFRKAQVLVVGSDGAAAGRLAPAGGMRQSLGGPPRTLSPSVAWRMVPLGDGSGGVVMMHQRGVDDVIDPAAGGYGGIKGCMGIVESAVSVLTPDQATMSSPGLGMVTLAVDLAVSPDGTQVAIASPGNSLSVGLPQVSVTALATITNSGAGGGDCQFMNPAMPPTLIAGGQNVAPGQVVAVAFMSPAVGPVAVVIAQTREPAALWMGDTGAVISLATDPRTDTGHALFHANAGGGIACASCHPEGGEDGRVWNFACMGQRRTQSIRGGISGTEPFHWDGDETDFSHLVDDVFVRRMAGPPLSAEQKGALQGWIDTIPALPRQSGLDPAAVARGQAVFTDATVACSTCHMGARLTNNTSVDVGTGGLFQVPSLLGVSWRAPLMHTGCASTLADRFGTCGGDKHGVTSTLTSAQNADLITYLQSL